MKHQVLMLQLQSIIADARDEMCLAVEAELSENHIEQSEGLQEEIEARLDDLTDAIGEYLEEMEQS